MNPPQIHTHTIDQLIGSNIRLYRRMRGLTQGELGKKLDISSQQVQKYEQGINAISGAKLYTLSLELGIPFERWISEHRPMLPPPVAVTDATRNELLYHFNALRNGQQRHLICQIAQMMAQMG